MWRIALFVLLMWLIGSFILSALLTLVSPGYLRGSPVPWIIGAAVLAAAVGITVSARGLRRYARPARELMDASRRVEEGDYSVRIGAGGPREVAAVVRAFNQMTARLEATDAQRRSVLGDVAHELRTPLSIIRGQAEGIADGVYPGDAAHVAPILEAARAMEVLVEDLRTLVLTDAGSLTLDYEEVDVAVLVNEIVEVFRDTAGAGGVDLRAELAGEIPGIEADAARLRSVIGNLVANAIQHTSRGGSVHVTARPDGEQVVVTVRDTGAGIPEEMRPRVFERFVKGPGSTGSGLGLAIAKDLVELHHGSIILDSVEDRGTEVTVTLPLTRT
jgi:signal transduction histidine kinase